MQALSHPSPARLHPVTPLPCSPSPPRHTPHPLAFTPVRLALSKTPGQDGRGQRTGSQDPLPRLAARRGSCKDHRCHDRWCQSRPLRQSSWPPWESGECRGKQHCAPMGWPVSGEAGTWTWTRSRPFLPKDAPTSPGYPLLSSKTCVLQNWDPELDLDPQPQLCGCSICDEGHHSPGANAVPAANTDTQLGPTCGHSTTGTAGRSHRYGGSDKIGT